MPQRRSVNAEPHLRFAVLATDVALFTIRDQKLCVRLMTVHRPPHFPGIPGLPGGLIAPTETAETAAARIITEKGAVASTKIHLEQLATFSRLDRDPRGRVVAVGYIALVPFENLTTPEQANDNDRYWTPVSEATGLAYDHDEILLTALSRLRARIHYTTIIGKLLPREFTLTELEQAYESILGNNLDKRNFRKKVLKLGIVRGTGRKRASGAFRPAELYKMSSTKVETIEVL
jgi:8-oxo-dGTP diphosphatase